jgi:type I restriction enzyme S subunit
LRQRKLDGLRELKKGYLQQMFPQAGERVPRVRFAGFSRDWQERRLGDVVEKLKSYSLSRDVESNEVTGFRYIHYGDIHKQVADLITNDEQLPSIKQGDYHTLRQGDLILADASEDYVGIAEPCIILHEPKDKVIAGLHTIALRPQSTSPLYLYYLLHTDDFKEFGSQMGTGLKVFGITFNNLILYKTQFPCLPEQVAIGNFFFILDSQITALSAKIERFKELKAAYLQKMFI